MKNVLALLGLATAFSLGAAANAVDYPTRAFDATYEMSSPATGKGTMRMVSDGKGHMRTETKTTAGGNVITITDYPGKMMTTLLESSHMAMKTPIRDNNSQSYGEDYGKRPGVKALGAKVVDGHPCHGYASTTGDGSSEVWIGDDIKYMVHSESKYKNGATITALKAFSGAQPAKDAFLVPAGYKEMALPVH